MPITEPPFRRVLFLSVALSVVQQIISTIRSVDGVGYKCFRMDEESDSVDLAICDEIKSFQPDLIVFIPTIVAFDRQPSRRLLKLIRTELGIPVVQIYTDMAKPVWRDVARHLLQEADYAASLDGVGLDKVPGGIACHPMWTPVISPAQIDLQRNIDVSMIGSLTSFPHRPAVLSYLRDHGIEVVTGGGGDTGFALSTEDYFSHLLRSKIVINFSRAGDRNFNDEGEAIDHLKGRVMETLSCQALLLESRNDVTAGYLEDGADYVSFADRDDLILKINFFLANEDKRALVAEQGHHTFMSRYSAEKFWRDVLRETRRSVSSR